jgi:AraC-like DNA-binding protein
LCYYNYKWIENKFQYVFSHKTLENEYKMISLKPNSKFTITGIVNAIQKNPDSSFSFVGESHPFWELVYVRRGSLEIIEREEKYILGEGELICHAPDEFHRIKSTDGTMPSFSVISFTHDGELPARIKEGVFPLGEELGKRFDELSEQLTYFFYEKGGSLGKNEDPCAGDTPRFSIVGNPDKIGQAGIANLTAFILALSMIEPIKRPELVGRARDYAQIVRTMHKMVDSSLSLSELCKIHHISSSYLTKLFLSYAGEGAMTYFGRIRIARIKELLRSGESVSGICELMSFSSPSYLSSFFKRWCGMSPAEWIKAEKNKV